MKESIYIVATPYQTILATIIAAYMDKNPNKILIVSPHFKNYKKIFNALTNWDKNPFSDIEYLEDRSDYSTANKMSRIFKNLGRIRKIMRGKKGIHGYLLSIGQPENMLLAHLIKKSGGSNTYVEDGSMVYCERKLMKNPFHRKIIKRIIYGSWYIMGDSELDPKAVNDALLLHPELIAHRPEGIKLRKIPNEYFKFLESDGYIRLLMKEFGLEKMGALDAIIVAPYFNSLGSEESKTLIGIYSRIIEGFSRKGKRIVVKYHPRESNKDILKVEGKFEVLPQALPLEVAFYNLKDNGVVIGDTSTALYTAKIIKPAGASISIMNLARIQVGILASFLEACGVAMPKTMDELESALKN
jgi:hypothetical protein